MTESLTNLNAPVPEAPPKECFECQDDTAMGGPMYLDRTCKKCVLGFVNEGCCPYCFNDMDIVPPECGMEPPYCPHRDDAPPLPPELDAAINGSDGLPLVPPS